MTSRLRCCVPFCAHTRGHRKNDVLDQDWPLDERDLDLWEWICSSHWKMIRAARRRAYRRARKQKRTHWPLWRMLKREAIEKAAGL